MNKSMKIIALSIIVLISYSTAYGAEYTDKSSCNNTNYQGTYDQACTYKMINDLYSTALNNSYITNSYYTDSTNKFYQKIYTENTTNYSSLDNLYNEAKKDYIYQKKDYYFKKVASILKDAKNRSSISESTYNSLIDEYTRKIFYVEDISVDSLNNIYNSVLNSYGSGYNNSNLATSSNKDYYYNKIRDILNNAKNNGNITSSRYDSLINDYYSKIYNYSNVTDQNLINYYNEVNNNYSYNNSNLATSSNKDYYYNKIRDILNNAKNNGNITSSRYDSLINDYYSKIYNYSNITNQNLVDYYNEVNNNYSYNNSNLATSSNKDYYYNKIRDILNNAKNNGNITSSRYDSLINDYYSKIYNYSNVTNQNLINYYNEVNNNYSYNNSNLATSSNKDYYYNKIRDILNNAKNNGNITSSRYDSLINDYYSKIYNYSNVTNQNLVDYYNEVNNNYSNYNNFSSTYNKDYYYNKIRDLLITAKNDGRISSSSYDSLIKYYNDKIYNSGNISNQNLIDLYNEVYNARYYSTNYNTNYNTESNKSYYYNKIRDLFNDTYNKGFISANSRDFLIANYYNIIYSNANVNLEKVYNEAKNSYDNYISNSYDYYYDVIKSRYIYRLRKLSNDSLDSLSYKILALKNRYNSNQNEYQILKALEEVVKEIRIDRNINY